MRDLRLYETEKESAAGRAVPIENRFRIFARLCRLRITEPEHGAVPARSLLVQLKHAQNKFCGLTAEIQARITRDAQTES